MKEEYIIEDIGSVVSDPRFDYGTDDLNKLTYKVIGAAMEVHNSMGKGFSEVVYKDCFGIELNLRKIRFEREKKFDIVYKGVKIAHHY